MSVSQQPTPPEAIFQKISEHEARGELDDAENLLACNFGVEPVHPHAIHLSGVLAFRRGHVDEALQRMERSLQLTPDVALYSRDICGVYRALGRYDDALAAGRRAVTLAPTDAVAHTNLAIVHRNLGETDAALACADRALSLAPDSPPAHFERAVALLISGRLAEGWGDYEWRFRLPGGGQLPDKPQWDGAPMADGRLLLLADQGYGDVFQFSRYIAWAVARCHDVTVCCSPELRSLLRQVPGPRTFISRWHEAGEYTCFCPLSSLPRLHGTRIESIPAPIPYLHADPARVSYWRTRLDALVPPDYRRIAITWAGRPTYMRDRYRCRSTQLSELAPLAALDKTALIAVQKDDAAREVGGYQGAAPLLNLGSEMHDFEDTLALIEAVDLLVSVDTAVGHLAGAAGRPAWLALAYAADWRWLLGREDSPWYPQHRLFRQGSPGGWSAVFERIAEQIKLAFPRQ